jgi:hypothetical protein
MSFRPPSLPSNFKPAINVSYAALAKQEPAFVTAATKRVRGRRAEGLRYERKAKSALLDRFPAHFIPGPWLCFRCDSGQLRWCQPDGILLDIANGRCIVIEIKYHHTGDAWWQLWRLYIPVLQVLLPGFTFSAVEIVKWFDPSVYFPATIMAADPSREIPAPYTGIHILRA